MKKKPVRRKSAPKKRVAPTWPAAFLAALRSCGVVLDACAAAGIDRSTPYVRKKADPDFAAAWAEAAEDATDLLVREARRRAVEGVRRLKFHQGELIRIQATDPKGKPLVKNGEPVMVPYVEHEYSDTLLMFLIKGERPEKYRDNHKVDLRVEGEVAAVTEVVVRTREEAAALLAGTDGD